MNTSSKIEGFSLLEVVVTISIISLLLSVMLPAITKSYEVVDRVRCMNRARQLGQETHYYVEDNEGEFPEFFYSFEPGVSNTINILIQPKKFRRNGLSEYSKEIWVCPTDEQPAQMPITLDDGTEVVYNTSYGYNIDLLVKKINYWEMDQYEPPSDIVFFYDGQIGPEATKTKESGGGKWQGHYFGADDYVQKAIRYRHFDTMANILFADWHVSGTDNITADMVLVGDELVGTGGGASGDKGKGKGKKN